MKTLIILLSVTLIGMSILGDTASRSVTPPAVQAAATDQSAALADNMVNHGADFLSSFARWESATLSQAVDRAAPTMQAVMGGLLCLRAILVVIGLSTALQLLGVAGKSSHPANGG